MRILAATFLLLLAGAEVGLRLLVAPPYLYLRLIPDPLLGFRHEAGTVMHTADLFGQEYDYRINELGHRGRSVASAAQRPPGTTEVLMLGDSFLNGWGVREEQWIGEVVREELSAAGMAAEVHALCCSDYGTAQELLMLREHGPAARPDQVVLLLFPGNDVANNTIELAGWTGSPGDLYRPYLDPADGLGLRHALPWRVALRRSRLVSDLETYWLRWRSATVEGELGVRIATTEECEAAGRLPREFLEVFQGEGALLPVWAEGWRRTERLVLEIESEAERLGAKLVVLVIPHLFQVVHGGPVHRLDDELARIGAPPLGPRLDWNGPEERLEAFFHREGIDHVQLLTPLRERARERESVYSLDGHLSGKGHVLAGRLLARQLAGLGGSSLCFEPSAPVDIPELHAGEAWIDFTLAPQPEFIASGMLFWHDRMGTRPGGARPGAWSMERKAVALIPAGPEGITVRGFLPPDVPPPVAVRLFVPVWGWRSASTIEESRECEITFPAPELPEAWGSERRFALALLEVDAPERAESETAFLLTGFGAAGSEPETAPGTGDR